MTTLFLITDLAASLLVLGCVFLSLVDVGGFMHFWGLTIDTVRFGHKIIFFVFAFCKRKIGCRVGKSLTANLDDIVLFIEPLANPLSTTLEELT